MFGGMKRSLMTEPLKGAPLAKDSSANQTRYKWLFEDTKNVELYLSSTVSLAESIAAVKLTPSVEV